jgi:hypothetical protein
MSLKKITELFLGLGLMLCLVGSAATIVYADAEKKERRVSDRKGCHNNDKNASADEEKSSSNCDGTVPTPEPVSIILFTVGLAGVGFAARRRLRRAE